ncbi:histidine phosphatase superfamily (branch 2) domain-containing protein [Phthorimaea operculella]|nr:histidine phosphatase superfamily (branch 2) domain-containing protein [Phthorimaea operculella]
MSKLQTAPKKFELLAVIFRHGDRTPDQEELDLYPEIDNKNILFPFGPKALTNKGKQLSYRVGKYLRRRYDKLVNRLYLPEEIALRSTEYDRTKMTALAAMAGMYPPPPAQRWNPSLDWQPVTYKTVPYDDDDLLYWYNCPRYLALRNKVYEEPEVAASIQTYNELFKYLSNKTKTDIDTPEDVFYLSNLFQALNSINIQAPKWVRRRSKEINDMTKLEYNIEYYNPELIRLSSGVLINEIRDVMTQFVNGRGGSQKLRMYSAHENNVAALMAAVGAFEPHQPPYGATFSLELRRGTTGEYSVMIMGAHENNVTALMAAVAAVKSHQLSYGATFFLELRRGATGENSVKVRWMHDVLSPREQRGCSDGGCGCFRAASAAVWSHVLLRAAQRSHRRVQCHAHENNVAALMAAVGAFEPHQPPYGATFSLDLRREATGEYSVMIMGAHENNVAALMAAVGAFEPHQPPYGATFSLELRRGSTGEYNVMIMGAHENNVTALMAAVGAFEPHQPPYGATFSLELRRGTTGEYSVMAVYTVDPLVVDERVLEMSGCNGQLLCPFDTFLKITSKYSWTNEQWKQACPSTSP